MPAGRPNETRERLLQATRAVIVASGWGGVTTRAVAEEAGVNAGLVHYHFASVDELRREAVYACLDAVVDARQRERDVAVVVFEAFLASLRDDALRAGLVRMLRRSRTALAARLPPGTDPTSTEATAAVLVAALDGLSLHRLVDPETDLAPTAGPFAPLVDVLAPDGETSHENETTDENETTHETEPLP